MVALQDAFLFCNYSTQYAIPDNGGHYLYNGVDLYINFHYQILNPADEWRAITVTGGQWGNLVLRNDACWSRWFGRCTITANQCLANCVSDTFIITVSDFGSRDYDRYTCNLATNLETYEFTVPVIGRPNLHILCSIVFMGAGRR